eukprot:scaffold4305_cov370-Prasinococcus_capsulatus_cf.AAC.3
MALIKSKAAKKSKASSGASKRKRPAAATEAAGPEVEELDNDAAMDEVLEEEEEDLEDEEDGDAQARKALEKEVTQLAREAKTGNLGEEPFLNKEKVLLLSTRGITHRYRHLMDDLYVLLPHCKKEVKLDEKQDRRVLNEVAELKGCTSTVFFEIRKRKDCYMWLGKTPNGPSAKFLVENVHTMGELKLTGNHLRGSRPILSFSADFDEQPHLQILKELFIQIFGTPKGHRKSKPFIDHVLNFAYADGRVWFRNYQIADQEVSRATPASCGGKERSR